MFVTYTAVACIAVLVVLIMLLVGMIHLYIYPAHVGI